MLNKRKTNHFLVAHRDDALLTFGGILLNSRNQNTRNIVYLVYGFDGNVKPHFLEQVIGRQKKALNYINSLVVDDFGESIYKILVKTIRSRNLNALKIGILIRKLEELFCSTSLGAELNEFHFKACKKYDRTKDTLINEKNYMFMGVDKEAINTLRQEYLSLEIDIPNFESPFKMLKKNIADDTEHSIYVLSGIGGHPDHCVLAKSIQLFKQTSDDPPAIFLGRDLPYASIPEWFQFSPFKLNEYKKIVFDITNVLNEKVILAERCYQSQLESEDFRILRDVHTTNFQLLHRDFYFPQFPELFNGETKAVDVIYRL